MLVITIKGMNRFPCFTKEAKYASQSGSIRGKNYGLIWKPHWQFKFNGTSSIPAPAATAGQSLLEPMAGEQTSAETATDQKTLMTEER
jgi:hypothetical protein